ncbi:MAG: hypothetical protein ACKN9U_12865 [Pirellulaceae bacterium]
MSGADASVFGQETAIWDHFLLTSQPASRRTELVSSEDWNELIAARIVRPQQRLCMPIVTRIPWDQKLLGLQSKQAIALQHIAAQTGIGWVGNSPSADPDGFSSGFWILPVEGDQLPTAEQLRRADAVEFQWLGATATASSRVAQPPFDGVDANRLARKFRALRSMLGKATKLGIAIPIGSVEQDTAWAIDMGFDFLTLLQPRLATGADAPSFGIPAPLAIRLARRQATLSKQPHWPIFVEAAIRNGLDLAKGLSMGATGIIIDRSYLLTQATNSRSGGSQGHSPSSSFRSEPMGDWDAERPRATAPPPFRDWLMRIAKELHQTLQTVGIDELHHLEATSLAAIEPSIAKLFQVASFLDSPSSAVAEPSRPRGKS